jgi:hypothetical protein
MKRILVISIMILAIPIIGSETFAQPVQGKKFEFSTSASIYNVKENGGETNTSINIPLRIGYYIFRGLEIEPEFLLTIPEESEDTGYFILVNLVYNFKASEKLMPFVLAGGGYGNGYTAYSLVFDWDMGVTALNAGAGIKYLVGDSAALRIEYRFTKYSGEEVKSYTWGSYTEEIDRTDNNILVGISLFF